MRKAHKDSWDMTALYYNYLLICCSSSLTRAQSDIDSNTMKEFEKNSVKSTWV